MRKTFKKIAAAVMAAATLAVGSVGMTVSAVDSYSWATRYVAGAPGSESTSDYCNLSYSTFGAKVKCTGSTHTNANASGWTWVAAPNTNAYMARVKLYYDSPKNCFPSVSGVVTSVKYTFSAYSSPAPDTFKTSGKIAARTSSTDNYS